MTSKGLLLLSIALVGAAALGGAIAIDSARPPSPPVVAVDLAGIAVEPAHVVDPADAARPQPVIATTRRLAEMSPAPAAATPGNPLQILFGTAFAAVPRITAPPQPPLDPWAGALQEVTRSAPVPQEGEPVLVPVGLPGPGAEAARLDPPARLADPLPPPAGLPVATPPAQETTEPPLAAAEGVADTAPVEPVVAPAARSGAATLIDVAPNEAKPVVVASLGPTDGLLAETAAASPLSIAPVAAVAPATADAVPPQPALATPSGSGQAVVAADAVAIVQPAAPGAAPVWARPRSSLLRVDRPEPEEIERLDTALARAVSLIEPAGAPWLRDAEADGSGRRLTGCGPGDLACTIFVSGRGSALDQPSPLLRQLGTAPMSIGGVPLPAEPAQAERALRCLAFTAYTEAGNQGTRGMAAVGWVVMNRIAVANDFGDSPCEVLADPGQFEPLSRPRFRAFAKAVRSGAMPQFPQPLSAQDEILQRTARLVVWQMLDGYFADDPTDGAQYFLAPAAMRALGRGMPAWTSRFRRSASIGDHVFYRPKRGG
ncbi:cell wall hydrolase [Inquilinus sp. Marseille-Q2685]|uniref:cell wall hydrolase n=1 Tax=Inquilinus sp. Marseille-Q2685 TaxID=2866581 RepID=UPI001CE427C5|nr:cell wall hydrolase [Inquilinus sp. Marseille-Q2685]